MIKQNENAMIQNGANKSLHPEKVLQQVNKVRRSKRSRDRKYALLVGAAVLAVLMLVAMFIESQLNLFSYTLRFGLTLFSLAATVFCAWQLWIRGDQKNERLVSAAKDIDANHPSYEQRVSTLTSCKEEQLSGQNRMHPAMLNRLTEETVAIHQRVEAKPIVSYRMLKLPLMCLAGAALVLVGLFVWDTPKTLVQLGRFCAPWSNLSTTSVTAVEANHVAARNEPFKLTASLAGRPVNEVAFHSKSIDGSDSSVTRLWPSTKDNTIASVRQAKASDSFYYRFRAGDGQTDWYRLIVADRPKIEDLTMRIVPPAYTGRPAKTFRGKLPKKFRTVFGSRLEVDVTPKSGIRTARLVMGDIDWLPMARSSDGQYKGELELRQPVKFKVQLTELNGLLNRRPPTCQLNVVADKAPKIKFLKPNQTSVLLDEIIDIPFKASDDYGIKEMALRVTVQREDEDEPTVYEVAIPIESESDNRKIEGSVELDLAQYNLKHGDTIRYEIRASDHYRPLEEIDEEIKINPMEDVEFKQAATTPAANNVAAENASSNNEAPAALGSPKSAPSDNASVAKPSDEENAVAANTAATNDTAANNTAANNTGVNNTGVNNAAGNSAATSDTETRNAAAESNSSPSGEPSAEQPPADQIAEAAPNGRGATPDNPANAPPAQSAPQERTSTAKDSNSSQIAKSAPAMQPDNSASGAPPSSSAANGSSNSPASNGSASPSQSGQSSQGNQSQQANSQQGNSQQGNLQQGNSQQDRPDSSSSQPKQKLAANKDAQPDLEKAEQDPTESAPEPTDMAARSSNAGGGQSSSSGERQIKVEKYPGGFTSELRGQLEMDITPTLVLLTESLIRAGKSVREVMSDPSARSGSDAALSRASDDLKIASESVIELNEKTEGTPYVFVGLRLESIRLADVAPAREEVQNAIEVEDGPRLEHSRAAWHHISRALGSLEKLEEKYEQVKRDLKRADDILKFKKMHRIFLEKSLIMLSPSGPGGGSKQDRKKAEYSESDLDEEYLKRLKEVMEMRREMQAELARILGDDPQLLRRYMTGLMKKRSANTRSQLTFVARDQEDLSLRVEHWVSVSQDPAKLANHQIGAMEKHLAEIEKVFNDLADMQNDFLAWLPLVEGPQNGDVADTIDSFKAAGSGLTEILSDIEAIFVEGVIPSEGNRQIAPLLTKSTQAEEKLANVGQSLRQLIDNSTDPEVTDNAARRFAELQPVQRDVQLWAGKLELLKDGLLHEVYSVEQENRRDDLLRYSVKLASLESQLVSVMRGAFEELPAGVPEKAKELQELVDAELPAAQLVAAQTLLDNETASANLQQQELTQDFDKAERIFDDMLQAIADKMDTLPPEDPLARLLRDPTLDEILLSLESEQDFLEGLALSARPSNLQIVSLWTQQMQQMRRLSNAAYRNALNRAQVKTKSRKRKLAKDDWRWNLVAAKLGEDMLQGDNKIPPERYRSAIKQYTDQISELKNDQENDE